MKKIVLMVLVGLCSISFGAQDIKGAKCEYCHSLSSCKSVEECELAIKKQKECLRNCK